MKSPAKRIFLGRVYGLATRQRIYRFSEGLEVDDVDHYEVTRKRVFFEDILLVTRHRYLGASYVLSMACLAIFNASLALAFSFSEPVVGGVFGALALVFAVFLAVRSIFKAHAVTVYGKRTKAAMRFGMRRERAARVFGTICRDAHVAQRRLAAAEAAAAPALPPEEIPLPPSA